MQLCCYQSKNYEIWKQFTTIAYTVEVRFWLLSITKLQNLKAIHNALTQGRKRRYVVINHKTIKFESNSQQRFIININSESCYQSQNYKIWKQFTTLSTTKTQSQCCYQSQKYKIWKQFTTKRCRCPLYLQLLSITKLQNLKAIHNYEVCDERNRIVVINHKTTKFESNSQPNGQKAQTEYSCYQSQNYKIWKQFTTLNSYNKRIAELLSITKLQNLKAIHNLALRG